MTKTFLYMKELSVLSEALKRWWQRGKCPPPTIARKVSDYLAKWQENFSSG